MKAGITPGNLGGYLEQLKRFGTMKLADVFAPAIEYAEKGYPIDVKLAQSIARGQSNLSKYPTSAKIFLPNGQPHRGDRQRVLRVPGNLDLLDEFALGRLGIKPFGHNFTQQMDAPQVVRFMSMTGG